jgi:nucleotide-binding universal stress UspA family protein
MTAAAGPRRIVVGLDGSENAHRALTWAIGLARSCRADLVAVHALGLLDLLENGAPVPTAPHRGEIAERFKTVWCAPLRGAGITNRLIVRDGTPVDVLLMVADEEQADLIVVGSRGLGNRPEQVLGSTSHQLAAHASTPVVIVPPGS